MKKHTARGKLFKEKFGPNPISTYIVIKNLKLTSQGKIIVIWT